MPRSLPQNSACISIYPLFSLLARSNHWFSCYYPAFIFSLNHDRDNRVQRIDLTSKIRLGSWSRFTFLNLGRLPCNVNREQITPFAILTRIFSRVVGKIDKKKNNLFAQLFSCAKLVHLHQIPGVHAVFEAHKNHHFSDLTHCRITLFGQS